MSIIIRILCIVLPLNAALAIYGAVMVAIDGDYIGAVIAALACPMSIFLWTFFRWMDREYRTTN
jgi:hypothetical protein